MSATNPGVSPDPGKLLDERLDPEIAELISKHILPDSAVGVAIASRIRELIEEARKEGEDNGYLSGQHAMADILRPRR